MAAFRAALEEYTRERTPLDWAATQNNLGNALSLLGAWESGTARLEEAVAAYRAALEEWTREPAPLRWARTQTSLGEALVGLAEREGDVARAEETVEAFPSALQEATPERHVRLFEIASRNFERALALLERLRRAMNKCNPAPLTPDLQAELDALAARPAGAIDVSEMPEVTDWRGAVRGAFTRRHRD